MLRMRSFALLAPALLLTVAGSHAAPPGFVSPPSTYHYPSSRDTVSPANRSTSHYFAPPMSYYQRPSYPEPASTPQYPTPPMTRSPVVPPGLDLSLVPRVLREPEPAAASAQIDILVPEGAELWFNGTKTQRTGTRRVFETPPLEPGTRYAYDVKARWTEGGKALERTLHVPVSAGSRRNVDFTK